MLLDQIKKIKQQRGDTIIEVLLSVSILGLVLAMSFTSSSRSLNAGTDAANRNQALAYAQEQVELLRTAANDGAIKDFPTNGSAFCIDPSTGGQQNVGSDGLCHLNGESIFGVAIKYDSSNQVYNVAAQWQGINIEDQVSLYYQVPADPITTTPNVNVSISASPAVISYGESSQLSWNVTTNTASATCNASGAWSGPKANSGTLNLNNITTSQTYSLTCVAADGSSMTRSAKIYVSPLPAPTINFSASPNPVTRGNRVTLTWTTSNATDCRADGGPWGGDKGTRGSEASVPLNSDTTFALNCTGQPGAPSKRVTQSVTTVDVAPVVTTLTPIVYGNGNVYFRSNINPNGYATTAWYEWSINSNMSGCTLTTSAFSEPAVNYAITDTRYGSYWGNGTPVNYYNCNSYEYFYRVCAYNNYNPSNIVCGDPVLFGMLAPSVTTGGATHDVKAGVSNSSGWELAGTVNPNATNVDSCYFKWDNDSDLNNGEQITNCSSLPGGGAGNVGVGTHIDLDWAYRGEEDNRNFYYQLCAHNSVGTSCGSVQSFHTQ
ncbi:MAG TPA: type II secretion system protein [Candidatus Saccharimonadales bacterium]|nr:type II secretion system protein [Candidatus Saccharimonadales bacterium]